MCWCVFTEMLREALATSALVHLVVAHAASTRNPERRRLAVQEPSFLISRSPIASTPARLSPLTISKTSAWRNAG
jgi:hypothetical protein